MPSMSDNGFGSLSRSELSASASLDDADTTVARELAHRALDDIFDTIDSLRNRPVWQKMPEEVRKDLRERDLPIIGRSSGEVYTEFCRLIEPYANGNSHPRFFGWVQGGGTIVGLIADMLISSLNGNAGARDHSAIELERLVIRWSAEIFDFPDDATGTLTVGSSQATLIACLIALRCEVGFQVREDGLTREASKLRAYASVAAHGCIARALDLVGLGTSTLRRIPTDDQQRMNIDLLRRAISRDKADGLQPFLVVGTAGTVDTGAIDALDMIADLAEREHLWFHVDAAIGGIACLSPVLRPRFKGIERADSVAFDYHKWAQMQYDCGCILVRHPDVQNRTFGQDLPYLRQDAQGLASNGPWPCDLGPDLSRSFRALKVWMSLEVYGSQKLAVLCEHSCFLAQYLVAKILDSDLFEQVCTASLNIVVFKPLNTAVNVDELVAEVQLSGVAVPSVTSIAGSRAIRVCILNHRTVAGDIDILFDELAKRVVAPIVFASLDQLHPSE